jgi:hypothetical protein
LFHIKTIISCNFSIPYKQKKEDDYYIKSTVINEAIAESPAGPESLHPSAGGRPFQHDTANADTNRLDPMWIPPLVRQTLLDMHKRAVVSRSDSNIKSKHRSSNHLLHSAASIKSSQMQSQQQHRATTTATGNTKKSLKASRKKKPLSLQNSQDHTVFHSVTPKSNTNSTQHSGSNILNLVYDELRSKFFRNNSIETNKSSSSANTNNQSNSLSSRARIPTPTHQHQSQNIPMQEFVTASNSSQCLPAVANTSPTSPTTTADTVEDTEVAEDTSTTDDSSLAGIEMVARPALYSMNNISSPSMSAMLRQAASSGSSSNVSGFRKPSLTSYGQNRVGASMSSESDCTVILNVKAMDRQAAVSHNELAEKSDEREQEARSDSEKEQRDDNYSDDNADVL